MQKKGEILWEVGKELPEESWEKTWKRGDSVQSPIFRIPDTCSLRIHFYPAGLGNSDRPCFKFVRTDTTVNPWKIKGDVQLCHRDTLTRWYTLDSVFQGGKSEFIHHFDDYQNLWKLKIYNPLPELCYRWMYTISDSDGTETQPDPKPASEPEPQLAIEREPQMAIESEPQPAIEPEPQPAIEPEPQPASETEPFSFASFITHVDSYMFGWLDWNK